MIRALVVCVGLAAMGMSVGRVCAEAQSQQDVDQASTPHGTATSDDASKAAKPKPKKVWTNEDMSEVTGTISVVGTAQPKSPATPSRISSMQPAVPAQPNSKRGAATKSGDSEVDPKTLAQVKRQVQKLQAGIDQLDKQIEQLKGLSRGDSKNTGGLNADTWSYSTATIPDQIKTLESKRNALQTSLDSLMDAARASGIEPGQLR
jgi:outer membrane murein-binding lipoprotein Lpp